MCLYLYFPYAPRLCLHVRRRCPAAVLPQKDSQSDFFRLSSCSDKPITFSPSLLISDMSSAAFISFGFLAFAATIPKSTALSSFTASMSVLYLASHSFASALSLSTSTPSNFVTVSLSPVIVLFAVSSSVTLSSNFFLST